MLSQPAPGRLCCASCLSILTCFLFSSAVLSQQNPNIQVAGDLFVELDAKDPSAGTDLWINTAGESIGNFVRIGAPVVEVISPGTGVTFSNLDPLQADAYQCENPTPEGLVGPDPTRSIEAWVYNPVIADEETILAWGKRGGPDGTNMSFNYGSNPFFGAVGHWGGAGPDIGWSDAGGAPAAGQWHHLVYTYDGTTTRVYADGCFINVNDCEYNLEVLGAGVINTYPEPLITLASQIEADGVALTGPLRGTLSIGRVRIHDGVLTSAQIQNNFDVECPEFCPPPGLCKCDNCPVAGDQHVKGKKVYTRQLKFSGVPLPDTVAVTSPAGATLSQGGLLRYTLPAVQPATFTVRVECHNTQGTASSSWTVTLVDPPARANIDIAGELLVELCASHESAGTPLWLNSGTAADFFEIGDPVLEAVGPDGNPAVTFNTGATDDAYQCFEAAPAGLVGLDPTRSIEAWVFNPEIGDEETILSWGRRGGPAGTNMSFNYGANGAFGAIGHWDAPDIGWNDGGGAPEAGAWHHLVYTFDGDATATTRVYADGVLANSEVLGKGVINTYAEGAITLAVQITGIAGGLDFGPREGVLSIGKVRVHDGVLSPAQVFKNFNAERDEYGLPPPTSSPPEITGAPDSDSFCQGQAVYTRRIGIAGVPPPTTQVLSPAGATIDGAGLITYNIPDPSPASFNVIVEATNPVSPVQASWTVTRNDVPVGVTIAEELLVDLDARDDTAGQGLWTNKGSIGDFQVVGSPAVTLKGAIRGLAFNENGRTGDSYESLDPAPPGITGVDPTRTIEAWVWNDDIPGEETILSFGHRGGPDGTNMSFNYGTNAAFGAVGHWGAPDIGWTNGGGAPEAGKWHHLVYTYDGTTTRVYADGVLSNSEVLASGVINTYPDPKISIAQQHEADGVTLTTALQGVLTIGRVRIHDGVLSDCQVLGNYLAEKDDYKPVPCPVPGDPEYADTHCTAISVEELPRGLISHRVTATATDETGDPIRYFFTATDGVTTKTSGPQTSNVASFGYRNAQGPIVFTVTVDDRLDCDDAAANATCRFPPTASEDCTNGTDDDGDSKIDCADEDCAGNAACLGTRFHRGDADNNGSLQLTDAVRILGFLFLGQTPPTCIDAADADDNGVLQLTDAVRILGFLFLGQAPPAPPGPPDSPCGLDPSKEDPDLGCAEYTSC